jgi:hypothetical protein
MTGICYTIANMLRRLARKREPWAGMARHAVVLRERMLHHTG